MLLTKLLKRDFICYQRNTYHYQDLDIWFIKLDGKESKYGWTNTLENENIIIEEYTGDPNIRLRNYRGLPLHKLRAIFDIVDSSRKYIFRGIFKFDGDEDRRVWNRVKDNFAFPYELN